MTVESSPMVPITWLPMITGTIIMARVLRCLRTSHMLSKRGSRITSGETIGCCVSRIMAATGFSASGIVMSAGAPAS